METNRSLFVYVLWILVIGLTHFLFLFFSKKTSKLAILIPAVLIPVWIISAIALGIEHLYFDGNSNLFNVREFIFLLAETFGLVLIFGGITFTIKYLKFKKKKNI